MQEVSKEWKNAHKQTLLNESFVEISLDITDPDAQKGAMSSSKDSAYISQPTELASEIDKPMRPYSTLEQNIWLLNGKREIIPETNALDGGYVSDVVSNEECVFNTKIPTIDIRFGEVHTKLIPGITIKWGTAYDEYAEHFIVTAYNENNVVARKEVIENTTLISVVEVDIVNYNRITIEILSWCSPGHRARIDDIFIGINKVYTKRDLFKFSHSQTVDPISTSLPKDEISFSVDNSDNSYNPYNKQGLAKYLMERQEIKTRYGLKVGDNTIEWVKGGSYYLSEWYANQNGISAEFVARDILEFLSATYAEPENYYYDNITSKFKERTLYEIAYSVLGNAGLPLKANGDVKWVIDEKLKEIKTTAPLPKDTFANCLQLIANAGCCVLYVDRDGDIHIEAINDIDSDYEINSFNSYTKSEITLSKMLKQVNVEEYTYSMGEKGVEHSIIERNIPFGDIGEIITIDNPLITSGDRAVAVGQWMGNYLKNRMTLKSSVRADVRLDALDIISNANDYDVSRVRLTNVKFEFNGAFRGTTEGRVI